jgi:cytidylate kinase
MNIVTVSRLVGSYGDEIAAIVAERMGLEFIGRTALHELALTCDPEYSDACALYEKEHGPGFFERLFFDGPAHKSLFEALTFEQASRGNVVILGRGAQIALRGIPGTFSVGVVAPRDVRIQRVMTRNGCAFREDAAYFVDKHDGERRKLIKAVFDRDTEDWSLYDLVINTACYTSETAADVVVHAIKKMEKAPDVEAIRDRLKRMGLAKRIETVIRKRLTSSVARNMDISVKPGGIVRITGLIREKGAKEKAGKIASDYPGVVKVENELKVTELSFGA